MANSNNYGGRGGKAPIVPKGQTKGPYGNDPAVKENTGGGTPIKP